MIDTLLKTTRPAAAHRVWLFSDIQMADVDFVRRCIETSLQDYKRLGLPCDKIWYLGDAGANNTKETAALQMALFMPLDIPLCFINGGHDFDLTHRYFDEFGLILPFYRLVQKQPGWKTTAHVSDFYFTDAIGPFAVYFFPEHAAEDWSWYSGGKNVPGEKYPYSEEDFRKIRREIESCGRPAILCSHAPFPPYVRATELLTRLFPLPKNVVACFHGHCHVGERSTINTMPYTRISWVGGQDIPQFNVSAMEDRRGDAIRSSFLEIYDDGSLGVLFRNHSQQRWTEAFFLDARSVQ